jgi:cytochrome c biogenesis protein CcmG, thiol:disulfide interchange protein DsbE
VIFAAHWCPVCQREVPKIQDWLDEDSLPEEVDVYLVSTNAQADGPEYPPSEWLGGLGWSEPVLLDNADQFAAVTWGLPGYPYMVFVGADGAVVQRASGELPIEQFDAQVSNLVV